MFVVTSEAWHVCMFGLSIIRDNYAEKNDIIKGCGLFLNWL